MSVFSPNAGKCGPEITPYLDSFHAGTISNLHANWRLTGRVQFLFFRIFYFSILLEVLASIGKN